LNLFRNIRVDVLAGFVVEICSFVRLHVVGHNQSHFENSV